MSHMALPLASRPRIEEPIDSFLERVSFGALVPLGRLHDYLGLSNSQRSFSPAISLSREASRRLTQWTGLEESDIEQHTLLGRFPSLVPGQMALTMRQIITAAHSRWFFLSHSRFCPQCLATNGSWQVSWRLPWTVACPTHQTLLADSCPGCSRNPREYRHGASTTRDPEIPVDPRRCQQASEPGPLGWATPRCNKPLGAQLVGAATKPQLQAQEKILNSVSKGTQLFDSELTPERFLETAVDISRLGLRREHQSRRLFPLRDIDDSVKAITVVSQVLDATNPAEAARIIRDASSLNADWTHNEVLKTVSNRHGPLAPVLDHLLAGAGRVTTRLRRRQLFFPVTQASIDQVPVLLWRCAVPDQLCKQMKPRHMQFLMSLSLARMITGTWEDAAEGLGFTGDRGRAWSKYLVNKTPPTARALIPDACQSVMKALPAARKQPRFPLNNLRQLEQLPTPVCGREEATQWCPCVIDD